jgi:hypothetical protein
MDKEFFERKIKELTNEKLIDLLQKTGNEVNPDIFDLAKKEAELRDLKFSLNNKAEKQFIDNSSDINDKLRKWNWGAFLLAPIWTLANKLEKWTILCFVPGVNIIVIFYLGLNGSRLAFEKSAIKSVDDFMIVQKSWGRWSLRLFCIGLIVGLFSFILNIATN